MTSGPIPAPRGPRVNGRFLAVDGQRVLVKQTARVSRPVEHTLSGG